MTDAAKKSLVWLNLGCSPDWLLSSSVLQEANGLMEEVVKMKLKEGVAAAMLALATLLMEASKKNAGEEEEKPPEEWMVDDVSSLERLKVRQNANLNLNGIWSWSWVLNQQETVWVSTVRIEMKWRQRTENVNVEGGEAAPIREVEWMKKIPLVDTRMRVWKVAMVGCHALVWKQPILS
jgi:hypothetical protein